MTSNSPTRIGAVAAHPRASSWGQIVSPTARLQMVILALLLLLAYRRPITDLIVHKWWHDPNWSHGWLVPLFSLYFLSILKPRLAVTPVRPSWAGLVLVLGALAIYFWFLLMLPMGYPQSLSIIPAILGLTLLMGGWAVLRLVWFPICYLVLAIPLPDGLYFNLTFPLRKLASEVSSVLLSILPGVHTEVSGVVIDFIYKGSPGTLNVEEACSGMRLIMAFVALGTAMAYLGDRPNWQRVLMVLGCIPIAIFCNVIRVTTTGCLYIFDLRSWASGTPHELLGLAMLPIAFGLFALLGYVLKNLFIEEPNTT